MSLLNKSVGRKKLKLNESALKQNLCENPPSYLKGLLVKSEDEISIDPSFKE